MNLEQIRSAALETCYIGVLEALLGCKTHNQAWSGRFGKKISTWAQAKKIMDHEVQQWAIYSAKAADILDGQAKQALRASASLPTWILPEGAIGT